MTIWISMHQKSKLFWILMTQQMMGEVSADHLNMLPSVHIISQLFTSLLPDHQCKSTEVTE